MFSYFFSTKKYDDELLHGKIDIIKMENTCPVPWHSHEFLEFFYVLGGTAVHCIDGNEHILTAGDYMVIDYQTSHTYYKCNDFTIINCLFLPELIDDTFVDVEGYDDMARRLLFKIDRLQSNESIANVLFHDKDGRVKNIFENMLIEYSEREIGHLKILKYLLSQLIFFTIRQLPPLSDISSLTKSIMEMVDTHYNCHLTLSEICKAKHYSLAYSSNKFKAETGMTFTEYVQKKRISESCIMLSETDMSITDIANAVGYSNIKFFNRIFKEITHTSPRQFRNSHLMNK